MEKDGLLTAQKPGKTTLTVTTANKKKDTFQLEVLANELTDLCAKPTTQDIASVKGGWRLWLNAVEMQSNGALLCQFYLINGTAQDGTRIENMKLSIALGSRENVVATHTFASQKVSASKNKAVLLKLTLPAEALITRDFFLPDYSGRSTSTWS